MKYNSVRTEQLMRIIAVESLVRTAYIYPSQSFCGKLGGGSGGGRRGSQLLEIETWGGNVMRERGTICLLSGHNGLSSLYTF